MAFGRKWISHLTSFTTGMISDNSGGCSGPILFKIDTGSDITVVHLTEISNLDYTDLASKDVSSIGGVTPLQTACNLNIVLEFTELSNSPNKYSIPLVIPHPSVPCLMVVSPGQIKSLEPEDDQNGLILPKISILGSNVLKAFETFLGIDVSQRLVILERSLTKIERSNMIQVPINDYPDPLLPSSL